MSTRPHQHDAQYYLAGQPMPTNLVSKSQMAQELGMSRDRFRLLLRKVETTVAGFFTGRNKALTPAQQVVLRQFVRQELNAYNLRRNY